MVSAFQRRSFTTDDNVTLCVYDRPGPSEDAPTILLSHGLGGNLKTWHHLVVLLGHTHRMVTWDYRGLYESRLDPADKDVSVTFPSHVDDAVGLLEYLGVDRFVCVGWSMGVQVNFELAYRLPDRVQAVIALCGGFGRALQHTSLGPWGGRAIPMVMDGVSSALQRWAHPVGKIVGHPMLMKVAKGMGVVSPEFDEAIFRDLVADYFTLDFEVYARILKSLDTHNAEGLLPEIHVPPLVLAGAVDPMTPVAVARHMVGLLKDAELHVLAGVGHYAPLEAPGPVSEKVAAFLTTKLNQTVHYPAQSPPES